MSEHEIRRALRRRAIVEVRDLAVGSAHADIQHAEQRLAASRCGRLGMVHQPQRSFTWKHGHCAHIARPFQLVGLGYRTIFDAIAEPSS
jgi:hypothetical protein